MGYQTPPAPGDIIHETITGPPHLMYAVNTMCTPVEHMIIHIDAGTVQYKTTDSAEFIEMWKEMSE